MTTYQPLVISMRMTDTNIETDLNPAFVLAFLSTSLILAASLAIAGLINGSRLRGFIN